MTEKGCNPLIIRIRMNPTTTPQDITDTWTTPIKATIAQQMISWPRDSQNITRQSLRQKTILTKFPRINLPIFLPASPAIPTALSPWTRMHQSDLQVQILEPGRVRCMEVDMIRSIRTSTHSEHHQCPGISGSNKHGNSVKILN